MSAPCGTDACGRPLAAASSGDAWGIVYWLIYLVVSIVIAWVAFSLILVWFKPALYNDDGTVNWWTTLWVAAVILVFAWIIVMILSWVISMIRGASWSMQDPRMFR
jgi:hypothetical protein